MRGANYPNITPPSRIWVYQKTAPMPVWVREVMAEEPAPNGTFLIRSEMGNARVHPGNVIFEFKGHFYACPPGDVQQAIQGMEDRFAPPPPKDGPQVVGQFAKQPQPPVPATPLPQPNSSAKCGTIARPPAGVGATPAPQKSAISARPPAHSGATPKRWAKAIGNPPSVENRSPDELHLDDGYQRSTDNGASRALIKKIAAAWDWRMCLPLVVSKRDDGSLWVIDGQHRLAAAKLRGDIAFLPCCVGVYGSVADEAAMFVAMNRARKPMNRLDDFHAAIASGDSEAIEIAALITDAGFTVSRKTGSQSWVPGEVAFTSAIAKVLRKHGARICGDALKVMAEAFPDEVLNAGSSMFTALTKLAISPPENYDADRMFRALLTRNQREWASFLNETKGGGDERALQLRQVLLMAYEEVAADV